MERRNSLRADTHGVFVREINGDYIFTLEAVNIAEEGLFVKGKVIAGDQDHVSYLTFRLPNGALLEKVPARMVREQVGKHSSGVAYQFVSMDESTRIKLKLYLHKASA